MPNAPRNPSLRTSESGPTDRNTVPGGDSPAITQAMISAYDEYTHLTLDRRGFMNKLKILTGSAAAAAAVAPMLAASSAHAAMVAADDARLEVSDVAFDGATGEMRGQLSLPVDAAGPLPAVVVIHENRGLNEHIRDVARRLALEGFATLAVDFLSPLGGTPDDEDKAREMIGTLDGSETIANAAAARAFLAGHEKPMARWARSAFAGAADLSTIWPWPIRIWARASPITAGRPAPRMYRRSKRR
jgi:hypothetical protein